MEVLEGESCSFECILSHEDTGNTAVWMISGKTVGTSGRFRATRQGRKYTLAVREVVPADAGEVIFSVRDLTSKASLIVRGGYHKPGLLGISVGCTWALSRWPAVRLWAGQSSRGYFWGLCPSATGGGPEASFRVLGVSSHLGAQSLGRGFPFSRQEQGFWSFIHGSTVMVAPGHVVTEPVKPP